MKHLKLMDLIHLEYNYWNKKIVNQKMKDYKMNKSLLICLEVIKIIVYIIYAMLLVIKNNINKVPNKLEKEIKTVK